MDKDIGVKTSWGGIESFTDNSIPICVRCGIKLTNENKSKWSDVVTGNKTQGICRNCRTLEEIKIDNENQNLH